MESRTIVIAGGLCLIVGALSFVVVFSYLAANFDYPRVLDGLAAEVLPRLRAGGQRMRAVWAVYAFLPLLLIPGAVGALFALPSSSGRMSVALVAASVGAFAMCLGLIRWPSVHWALAEAYEQSGAGTKDAIAAVFSGLNIYLGNYIGEICLAAFFLFAGLSTLEETRFPAWLGWCCVAFSLSFLLGAFRNVSPSVQPVADINNYLLPLWMIILGSSLVWFSRRA
jgi:hypothetical protein